MILRARLAIIAGLILVSWTVLLMVTDWPSTIAKDVYDKYHDGKPSKPKETASKALPIVKYIPEPTWTPSPVKDPFPALSTISTPPPIPKWNEPKPNIHQKYGLDYAPPLFIGFTRTWPILLQAVVSYITAGWPPEQIYVIENTGVQRANADGKLTLQNPFFLNYSQLRKLGVNVIRTPTLLSFAQLQNFYIHLAHEHEWPYYFWSHMDVLVLSFEEGHDKGPAPPSPDYKTIYDFCLEELQDTVHSEDRWASRFFAYDHLTLVNREAYDAVGGWDTFIPYYITDCDMHSRLQMLNWTIKDRSAGIVTDVSTTLTDLMALYRDKSIEPDFVDPNPPPPKKSEKNTRHLLTKRDGENDVSEDVVYWRKLREKANDMFHYKHSDRGRNTWQVGQHGGQGEPFYYPSRGISEGIEMMTDLGKRVYAEKWGHRDCDLIKGTHMKPKDIWRVEHDW